MICCWWPLEIKSQFAGIYIKVVLDKASRIGCGFANCPDKPGTDKDGRTYVCNYAAAQGTVHDQYGNVVQDDKKKPFETGTPCSGCPGKCDNKLCGKLDKLVSIWESDWGSKLRSTWIHFQQTFYF